MTLRHLVGTTLAAAAAAALALLGVAGPTHAADVGTTPGTYTNYSFSGAPVLTEVTWSTTVLHDPGYTANVFWSHQFGFNQGNGAYLGMQSNGGSSRVLLFSVWDVSEATAGSTGSWCQSFGGEGEGMSCRMNLDWTAGHTYTFKVAAEGGGWFGATVADTTAGTSYKLGSIKTPATAISPSGMVDWTEYFEWNDPRATCYDQPFSDARFGLPKGNGGTVTATVSSTSNSGNACAPMTRTDTVSGGTVQNLAIGNSVRGPVTGLAGKCLDASGGVSDGTVADLYGCSGNDNQAWVKAADGTLRLPSDYCLTAAGTGNGAAVLVRDCAGTGAGGAVTDAGKQWTYNTSTHALVNKASGRCLDVPGSDSTSGTALDLWDCHGGANQQWTVPATY
ncbi:ricin-type beta-trefoil lectin domain protein [Streptomyces sp. NBC_01761]|uniref:ricin-type beta-trefoil lectin domain protein n=1 Tax=Streptomyces sp. NBC_01761 TaxID=2975932 RepID=UPI002DD97B9C|nr:ricin-type beta-trefoil lectin domain protein [Streptomyces sp. NBC_01761]WSC53106.1 ricin-type beta-trefoil lectin domain protein [Streptomyces sp. NBC_01761]